MYTRHPFARGAILIPKPKFYFHGLPAFQCQNIGRPIKWSNARPSNTTLTSTLTQKPIHPSTMDAYNNTFIQKSCNTFNKSPHEWQVDVGASILWPHNNNTGHNQLLIRKTGEGKSLVYQVTGACLEWVVLCISPLLSLAMDQSRKVLKYTPPTSRIASYHLDELLCSPLIELQGKLLCQLPTTTIFLYTFPQCLWKRSSFRHFLLPNSLINFVTIDEIHLFVQFASIISQEFSMLKSILFDKLLQSNHSIPTLFMTPTKKKKNSKIYTRLPKGFKEHHYVNDAKRRNPHWTL